MKFGVREICDVTFKTTSAGQKVGKTVFKKAGMPAFMIDTARTSSLEQSTTTNYAQGGRGYSRLIAWEGEKQMTFTVEDALISPTGLAVLTGAGLINPSRDKMAHVHITLDKYVDNNGQATVTLADLQEETGLDTAKVFNVCSVEMVPAYATVIDGSGAGIQFLPDVTISGSASAGITDTFEVKEGQDAIFTIVDGANKTVKLDFYLVMTQGVTEVQIKPDDFGGYFYVEAQTLFRREDTGKDMAAELILPKVKVQSGFTFTMAANGDPSTFNFTMDAFPGYTMFDKTKKVMCLIQVIGDDKTSTEEETVHDHTAYEDSPLYEDTLTVDGSKILEAPDDPNKVVSQANQDAITVTRNGDIITVSADVDALNTFESTNPSQGSGKWIGLAIDTGEESIIGVKYNDYALTQADVDEAASVNVGAGSFVLWLKAENGDKQFTLSKEGKADTVVKIVINDTGI